MPGADLHSTVVRTLRGDVRAQIVGRIALSLIAVCLDVLVVPAMYSARPFFTLVAFAALILVSNTSNGELQCLPRLTAARLTLFVFLHALLMYAGHYYAAGLSAIAQSESSSAPFAGAAKTLLVVPTIVLFPVRSRFFRRYASEVIAVAIVLFTFFPGRYFQMIWPWYSEALARGTAFVSNLFVPGTYLDKADLTVVGSSLDMEIAFTCSGITGINLFHLVFGFIAIVEWNRLNKRRALICYVVGGLVYMVANFVRLIILFLAGNLVSPNLNLDLIGWLVFAVTFYILMKITYGWMVLPKGQIDVTTAHAQVNAA